MYMSNGEICREYRWARNQDEQIKILSELNVTDLIEIILILYENGEQLTSHACGQLQQRMDELNDEIVDRERAYRRIAAALNGR